MTTEWNLDLMYKGLDDPAYEADIHQLEELGKELHALVEKAAAMPEKDRVEEILLLQERYTNTITKLWNYIGLSLSVNTEDGAMMAQENRLMKIDAATAADATAADRILGSVSDIDALAKESKLVSVYRSLLVEKKKKLSHTLSNDVEAMISSMDMTGGNAWGNLQSYLTSTVKVDYKDRQVTLSEIRNLAYDADPVVRKEAFEAELLAYEKIQDSIAFSINNIKNQVTMLCEKRGYDSPLAMTLEQSRMSKETLDAMLEAIVDYLPVFRKYFKHKAKKLGYENGLPWFELFAPLGESEKNYSLEDARECLLDCFKTLTPDMADMMKEAFENEWIDFYPRNGKQGGAFCAGLPTYKQSRILTNYDGSFGAVDTLAHELGHAYHNRQLENERPLNQDYPMPVAETASTFNEVHLGQYVLKQASEEERLALLESDLRECSQCIVDIYSRYLFESAVFEKSSGRFLMAEDLKALMLDAQKQAYGDGLDPAYLHPYMWVCKSHYYSPSLSFYNFPYAFGNLFARGLYALFLKEKDAFIKNYKEMLRLTPRHTMEENGAMLGIDLTKKEFWAESLQMIADEIEEFCKL